jgi:hypothetical protein
MYALYKYVKLKGTWRYCKAAHHDNGKIKLDVVFVNVNQALVEKHAEGRYYMSHNGQWIDAGTDAIKAQRKRRQRWRSTNSTGSAGKLLGKARLFCQAAQTGSRWQRQPRNISPTARPEVFIPRLTSRRPKR